MEDEAEISGNPENGDEVVEYDARAEQEDVLDRGDKLPLTLDEKLNIVRDITNVSKALPTFSIMAIYLIRTNLNGSVQETINCFTGPQAAEILGRHGRNQKGHDKNCQVQSGA